MRGHQATQRVVTWEQKAEPAARRVCALWGPSPRLTLSGRRPRGRCSALHSPPGDGDRVPCALRSAAFCSSGRATRRRTGPGSCRWSVPGTLAPAGARRGWGRCTSPEMVGPHTGDRPAAPARRRPVLCSGVRALLPDLRSGVPMSFLWLLQQTATPSWLRATQMYYLRVWRSEV